MLLPRPPPLGSEAKSTVQAKSTVSMVSPSLAVRRPAREVQNRPAARLPLAEECRVSWALVKGLQAGRGEADEQLADFARNLGQGLAVAA